MVLKTKIGNSVVQPKFMVDHMLIKLGKYLRILGYDAIWRKDIRTHELIRRANAEGRIFLTRNTRLPHQYPDPESVVFVREMDPVRQLHALAARLKLDLGSRLFSRCIRCNIELIPVEDKGTIRAAVHPNVFVRYDRFFTCPSCGTVFWKGSHVVNTCRKLELPWQLGTRNDGC